MSTQQVGENAGKIWYNLGKNGEVSTKELAREVNMNPDEINLALGWLARENKLKLSEKNRNIYVGLTDAEKRAYLQASHK
ncbi:MAG: winged helix-turn-helix domain-containing protein [Planctomycetes bacterium]|nr:winged helix-turn-helix domain-containing protein [Planctomycetota bacterium]